jgi:prevent-host-death family protein
MDRIGIRELRQYASQWLRRVQAGESFEITDRGRPLALLVPIREQGVVERLIAAGQMRPGTGKLSELGPPLPPKPGEPLPSEILAEMRAGER